MDKWKKERSEAITAAVEDDDFDKFRKYCWKYKVPVPKEDVIFKAWVYKAAQIASDIPERTKFLAAMKCIDLGFNPFMNF